MLKLASSLMAASALHVAVLAGTGWWHGDDGQARGPRHDPRVTQAAAHAGGWQWRLVTSQASATPAMPTDAAATLQDKVDAATDSAQQLAPSPSAQVKDEYLPRSQLSQPPRALSMIDIPFPPGVPTPGRYKAVLALYIDEQGVVRRAKIDGEALPAAYEEAARVSFQTASFQPGELRGQPVKSLIHVEVVFDDSQAARAMSASTLSQSVAAR